MNFVSTEQGEEPLENPQLDENEDVEPGGLHDLIVSLCTDITTYKIQLRMRRIFFTYSN